MDRKALIRHPFSKDSKLIEIGASYNPIIPKSEGWRTTNIDHADQSGLRAKYHDQPTVDSIEAVDYVWHDGPFDALIPVAEHGTYDGLIASHVGEHIPDLIGFLLSLDRVLAPHGIIALALPDLRVCFDFYRPRSTTGDLLDARGRVRHRRGKIFDNFAYFAYRGGTGGWAYGPGEKPRLTGDLNAAWEKYNSSGESADDEYVDAHGFCFTPTGFQLIILELFTLGVIPWHVTRIDSTPGVEFHVWLERQRLKLSDADLAAQRAKLLDEMILENEEQVQQVRSPVPATVTMSAPEGKSILALPAPIKPKPTITAIIPLYNGEKFIVRAIKSVLAQTVPPIELFIVNDGSTDNGVAVVEEFLATADLHGIDVRVIHKENGGQSSARNVGVANAEGDFIAFLDQDDEYYPLHNEVLLPPFIDPPPGAPLGVSYGNLDHANEHGDIMHIKMLPADQHPKMSRFQNISADMFVLPSACLILRAAFNEVGGFDERLCGYEDDDLILRICRRYSNFFINESVTKWCIHHESSSYSYRMVTSRNYYCNKLLEMFPDDVKRTIYYARDLILPRFYPHALAEYQKALMDSDPERIADTHATLRHLLNRAEVSGGIHNHMNVRKARRLRRLMDFVTPSRALTAYKLRSLVRPLARRMFL